MLGGAEVLSSSVDLLQELLSPPFNVTIFVVVVTVVERIDPCDISSEFDWNYGVGPVWWLIATNVLASKYADGRLSCRLGARGSVASVI